MALTKEQRDKLGIEASDSRFWSVNPDQTKNLSIKLAEYGDKDKNEVNTDSQFSSQPVVERETNKTPIDGEKTTGEHYGSLLGGTESAETTAEKKRQAELAKEASRATIDEDQVRTDIEDKFQGEIDAINKLYAQKRAEAELGASERLGQAGAIQARRGLLGSSFGESQKSAIISANQAIFDSIDAQKTNELVGVYSDIEDDIATELKEQQEAIEQGGADYLAYLVGEDTRRAERVNKTIANMINREVEPSEELYNDLAKKLGTTPDNLKAIYEENKSAYDAQVQAQAEVDRLAGEQADRVARKEEADIAKTEMETAKTASEMLPEEKTDLEIENDLWDIEMKKIDLEQKIKDLNETDTDYELTKEQLDLEMKNLKIKEQKLKNIELTEEGGEQGQSEYMKEVASRTIQSVDELIPQISGNTTGWGAFFQKLLPESEARTFNAQLDTLKGNIGFGALTAMREASKTGGALGQVSDREIKLLTSTLGALDQLQSAEQLTSQLEKIKESVKRWNKAVIDNGDDPWADYDFGDLGNDF